MSKTDQIHTRLARHGWMTALVPRKEGNYFYQRGDQWIELNADGTAYFGIDDRRIANGTHESVVAQFGETPDPASANAGLARVNQVIADLAVIYEVMKDDEDRSTIAAAQTLLQEYAEDLFDKARHE